MLGRGQADYFATPVGLADLPALATLRPDANNPATLMNFFIWNVAYPTVLLYPSVPTSSTNDPKEVLLSGNTNSVFSTGVFLFQVYAASMSGSVVNNYEISIRFNWQGTWKCASFDSMKTTSYLFLRCMSCHLLQFASSRCVVDTLLFCLGRGAHGFGCLLSHGRLPDHSASILPSGSRGRA